MLGSRKLLIVLLSCIVIGSVFVLGLSAEELVREDPSMTPEQHVLLRSVSAPEYVISGTGLSTLSSWLVSEGYTSSTTKFVPTDQSYYVDLDNPSGNGLVTGIWSQYNTVYVSVDGQPDHGLTSSRTLGFDSPSLYNFFRDTVGLAYSDFVIEGSNANIIANSMEIAGTAFSIGGTLLSFVTSSWITLVALVAVLLVLGLGVIRKLVKGV